MKNKIYSFAAAALLAAFPLTAAAQDITKEAEKPAEAVAAQAAVQKLALEAKTRIAVLDFEAVGDTPDLGEGAAEIFRTSLSESGKYTIIERKMLQQVLSEQKLGLTGAIQQDVIQIGKMLAAKAVMVGSVVKIGDTYTLNARLIDATYGQVIIAKNRTTTKREDIPTLCRELARDFTSTSQLSKETPVSEAEVTYEQVLERPDDAALNLAYAKTQVRRGDLKGAAATLERMLMLAPDTHDIRLFYALVLFRLDNLAEAGRELEAVQKSPAPAALKAEAAKYAAEISRRRQLNTVSASLAAGFSYDSNRNAAPLSGKRLLSDNPLALTGLSKRRDDMSLMIMGGAELRRTLDQRTRNDVALGLNYFRADQDSVKTVNLQAVSARLGGTYKYNRYSLKPALLYDNVTLHGARFLENAGLGLRAETPLDRRTSVSAELKYTYGEHHATPDVGANPERRGPLWSLSAGAGRALNPVMKLDADLTFSAKAADKSYNSYRDTALALRHSWLLGKGRFLLSSLALANSVYSRADAAISSKTRRDASLRLGATAGAPLAGLHPRLRRFENVTLTLTLEHFKSNSTVTNYTYENNKAALLAGYRWSLGF